MFLLRLREICPFHLYIKSVYHLGKVIEIIKTAWTRTSYPHITLQQVLSWTRPSFNHQTVNICALLIHCPLPYCCIHLMLMYCTTCAAKKKSSTTFFPTAFLLSLNVHARRMLHQVNIQIKRGTPNKILLLWKVLFTIFEPPNTHLLQPLLLCAVLTEGEQTASQNEGLNRETQALIVTLEEVSVLQVKRETRWRCRLHLMECYNSSGWLRSKHKVTLDK